MICPNCGKNEIHWVHVTVRLDAYMSSHDGKGRLLSPLYFQVPACDITQQRLPIEAKCHSCGKEFNVGMTQGVVAFAPKGRSEEAWNRAFALKAIEE